MSDIRTWLDGLELGEYAEVFEAEKVTLATLPELTDGELKELGLPLGPRKALLKAARESAAESGASPAAAAAQPHAAERRQITVMFCDLVGSTALSERLDPEDLRDLMAAYQKAAGAVIERYDGHVAQYLGDGLMTYFGWPRAHEDDAQRAVRSGLEIIEAVTAANQAPAPLQVRIGIATGAVVVGETGAGDASVPKAAIGETPNVAARVQGLAKPNTVTIAESTRRLIGGAFEQVDLGAHDMKGVSAAMTIYRVVGESGAETRCDAHHVANLTDLVGRDRELATLMSCWQRAAAGDGQVVLLSGEAGIGKSRVAETLFEHIGEQAHIQRRYQCSPYHGNSSLYPVINQIKHAAGFDRGASEQEKWDGLAAILPGTADAIASAAPVLAAMLSIDPGDRYVPADVSPQKLKQLTLDALSTVLIADATARPMVLIFEDAHWIDPTTREWLDLLLPKLAEHSVLALITYRPEFADPWTVLDHATQLVLQRIDRDQSARIIQGVTGHRSLPESLCDLILDKTDGVPIFVEELTKTVIDIGLVKPVNGAYELTQPLEALAIPATLQDSLMARLDQSGPAKDIAQTAACIGRTFSHQLLSHVAGITAEKLDRSIRTLVDSELIFGQGDPPTQNYIFKHALIQDAAYGSLLKSRRRAIHENIAATLEKTESELVDAHPELLAHHWTAAEQADKAVPYWLTAGQRAAHRSANLEAMAHLEAGMALLARLGDGQQRLRMEHGLRTALGPTVMWLKGFGAPEAQDNYDRLLQVSSDLNDDHALFGAKWGLWLTTFARGDAKSGLSLIDDMFALAHKDPANDEHMLQAHHAAWGTMIWVAKFDAVCEHAETGLALYDPARHQDHAIRYGGHDPGVCGHAQGGLARWFLGYPDKAVSESAQALDLANDLGHENSILHANTWQGLIALFARDTDKAMELGQRVLGSASDRGLPLYSMIGGVIIGGTQARGAEAAAGRERLAAILANFDAMGLGIFKVMISGFHAESCLRIGDLAEAAKIVETAIATSVASADVFWLPELKRLAGEILSAGDADADSIEASFQAAIETARGHGSRSLELRATTSLAGLWQSQGKHQQAHDTLAPLYDHFTEGFETTDLKDAKALLQELA